MTRGLLIALLGACAPDTAPTADDGSHVVFVLSPEDDGGSADAGVRDVGQAPREYTIINGFAVVESGGQAREVQVRLSGSAFASRFAIALGEPTTEYFGQRGGNFAALLDRLRDADVRVAEVRFVSSPSTCFVDRPGEMEDGVFGYVCGQGLPAQARAAAQLYDVAVQRLGYDRLNRTHRLVGIGSSTGATLLALAAFDQNRRFDAVALEGFLDGDRYNGCLRGQLDAVDEVSLWGLFRHRADLFTPTLDGCSKELGAPKAYGASTNFGAWPTHDKWKLAFWEGDDVAAGARPAHARFSAAARSTPTPVTIVAGCGHQPLACRAAPLVEAEMAMWLISQ